MLMKQVLCFGDSNTYGLIPGTANRYGTGVRWTSILSGILSKKGYQIIEEGLCGRTTIFEDPLRDNRRGAGMLPAILETHRPLDRVILMLGTNDCKTVYDASPNVIGQGIRKLINQIQEDNRQTKILLVSPIHLGDGVGEPGYDVEFDDKSVITSKELKAVYEQIASDFNIDFLAASDFVKPSEADREHMDANGHKILAHEIYKAVFED